jgi:hypothetical protein
VSKGSGLSRNPAVRYAQLSHREWARSVAQELTVREVCVDGLFDDGAKEYVYQTLFAAEWTLTAQTPIGRIAAYDLLGKHLLDPLTITNDGTTITVTFNGLRRGMVKVYPPCIS